MAKPFLTYDEQIDKLINEKHLQIVDTEYAKAVLKNIGYFSLIGGYKTPFINTMTRIYKKNVSFEDVFALYQFDLSLRELVFQYLCQIECKIRQLVSYSFCSKHGEQQNAYLDPNNYNNSRKNASDIAYLIQLLTYHATRNNVSRQDFLEFKREMIHILRKYMKSSSQISENSLLSMMGFPSNWKNITRYRI